MKANIIMYLMMYFIQTMSTKFYLDEFEKMSHFFLTYIAKKEEKNFKLYEFYFQVQNCQNCTL